ncbi:hypothetical protein Syun_008845 [Stephania yunnanensis]|uniref:J domain-containing protein n=1 Tax=Stephania yunnanensis TaxID=152371 RepID=A0AAP0PRR2_9MAGN
MTDERAVTGVSSVFGSRNSIRVEAEEIAAKCMRCFHLEEFDFHLILVEAEEIVFKELAQTYEVLSDPEKREIYDQYGEDALKEGMGGGAGGHDPFDIFSSFFGGGNPFGANRGRRREEGEDVIHPLKISLEDLYSGTAKKLSLSRNVICSKCNGSRVCYCRNVQSVFRQRVGAYRNFVPFTFVCASFYRIEHAFSLAMMMVNTIKLKEEFDYESLCRKLEQQVDYLTAETERQNKQREDDKEKMERKINESLQKNSKSETELETEINSVSKS